MFKYICKIIINTLFVYAAWIGCLEGAAYGYYYWPSIAIWAAILGYFIIAFYKAWPNAKPDLKIVLVSFGLGFIIESFFLSAGLLEYKGERMFFPHSPPLWVMTMYGLLAICMNHSLSKLKSYLPLAALLGGVGAFLTYGSGSRLEILSFNQPGLTPVLIISLTWAFLFPLLLWLAKKL